MKEIMLHWFVKCFHTQWCWESVNCSFCVFVFFFCSCFSVFQWFCLSGVHHCLDL